MAEPTAVSLSFTIDALLAVLDDELHGLKGAFSEPQKIRRLNKAIDQVWAILKELREGYFLVSSQSADSAKDDFFPQLTTSDTEVSLPKNFGEMRWIETTSPTTLAGLRFLRTKMSEEVFREERIEQNSGQTGASSLIDSIHYDIIGPGATGRQTMVLARPVTQAVTAKLWYIRTLPKFGVPKVVLEELAAVLSPYVHSVVTYATKSLLQSENKEASMKWEQDWREDLRRSIDSAQIRQSADPDTVQDFGDA